MSEVLQRFSAIVGLEMEHWRLQGPTLKALAKVLQQHRGTTPAYMRLRRPDSVVELSLNEGVTLSEVFLEDIERVLGGTGFVRSIGRLGGMAT